MWLRRKYLLRRFCASAARAPVGWSRGRDALLVISKPPGLPDVASIRALRGGNQSLLLDGEETASPTGRQQIIRRQELPINSETFHRQGGAGGAH